MPNILGPSSYLVAIEEDILRRAARLPRPSVVAYINLRNFRMFNLALGEEQGDLVLEQIKAHLEGLGQVRWLGSDAFVVLIPGSLETATSQLRAFSWRFYLVAGLTYGWSFQFDDGRKFPDLPKKTSDVVVCTPMCGIAAVESDPKEALKLALERYALQRRQGQCAFTEGFARAGRIIEFQDGIRPKKTCPACKSEELTTLGQDIGESRESCKGCGAVFRRLDVRYALGERRVGDYV